MRNAGGVSGTWNQRRVGRMGVLSAVILAGLLSLGGQSVQAADPIKVGILHSLTGTMAISEAPIKEVVLMAIDEINAAGGVMGRKVEPVVEDPASNWDLFAEKAKKLLQQDKVATVFGCWTSVSRKSVLPVFEQNNSLLFYPVQYEGEECSKNVIYTGATINQQASPAVDFLMGSEGANKKRFYTRTIRPSWAKLKVSVPVVMRQSSIQLTAIATCPSSRNSPTRGLLPTAVPRSPSASQRSSCRLWM